MTLVSRFILSLALAVSTGLAHAGVHHVSIDTSAIAGSSAFSLDFQFIGGSPSSNTATIGNFDFGGGITTGPAILNGSAAGSPGSAITLFTDSSNFFNEFIQRFIAGSALSFDVTLSDSVNTPTPDAFSFAILDSNLFNIDTTDIAGTLLHIDIDGVTPTVSTFAGINSYAGITTQVVTVPEPGSLALIGLGLLATVMRRRTRA